MDWCNPHAQHEIFHQFNRVLKPCTMATASSSVRYHTCYQPSGTCILAHGPWQPRCRQRADPLQMGCWSALLVRGHHQQSKLAVISTYRVCNQDPSQAGGHTAFMQQWRLLRTQNPNNTPDPRKQFFRNLQKEIHELVLDHYKRPPEGNS